MGVGSEIVEAQCHWGQNRLENLEEGWRELLRDAGSLRGMERLYGVLKEWQRVVVVVCGSHVWRLFWGVTRLLTVLKGWTLEEGQRWIAKHRIELKASDVQDQGWLLGIAECCRGWRSIAYGCGYGLNGKQS